MSDEKTYLGVWPSPLRLLDSVEAEAYRARSWQMMLDHVGTYEPKPLDSMGRPKMARAPTKRKADHAFNKFDL